jgi:hypothetical protein
VVPATCTHSIRKARWTMRKTPWNRLSSRRGLCANLVAASRFLKEFGGCAGRGGDDAPVVAGVVHGSTPQSQTIVEGLA